MSWRAEVQTAGGVDKWAGNKLTFATAEEAQAYVADLMMRWTAVTDTRVVKVSDPVTHTFIDKLEPIDERS
jgi:hypothetical protein